MIAVRGRYENGKIKLERNVPAKRTIKVIVAFQDEELMDDSRRLTEKDFSFRRSREILKAINDSLSDAVLEDRRAEL